MREEAAVGVTGRRVSVVVDRRPWVSSVLLDVRRKWTCPAGTDCCVDNSRAVPSHKQRHLRWMTAAELLNGDRYEQRADVAAAAADVS